MTSFFSHNTSEEFSKSKVALTSPSSSVNSVTSSSPTPVAKNGTVKNQSFLQTSLGEISPSEQTGPSQLSSVIGDITPQNTSLSPPQDGQSNATEKVSDIIFIFKNVKLYFVLVPTVHVQCRYMYM